MRIALDEGDDLDAKIERVADAALDAGAEDFETDEPSDGTVEVEVRCYESCLLDAGYLTLPPPFSSNVTQQR